MQRRTKIRRRDTTEAIIGAITGTLSHDQDGRLHGIGRTVPLRPDAARLLAEHLTPGDPGHPWTGVRFASEGHVNRIKMLRRQMFGRAGFELLRKRVLLYRWPGHKLWLPVPLPGLGVLCGGVSWGREPRSQGVNTHRGPVICAVVVSAAVLPLSFATSAAATDVVGVGNSAHDNHCANRGGPLASAATVYAAGVVSALTAAVPLGIPTNQCGGLGSPLVDQEMNNVAQCGGLVGAPQCAGNNFQSGGSFGGGLVSGGGAVG